MEHSALWLVTQPLALSLTSHRATLLSRKGFAGGMILGAGTLFGSARVLPGNSKRGRCKNPEGLWTGQDLSKIF